MPFTTYRNTRPWAKAIRDAVRARTMPPWFAEETPAEEPERPRFSNDRRLTAAEIETLAHWADSGAPAGNPRDAPPPRHWTAGWNIGAPDAVFEIPRAFEVPAKGAVDYQYFDVPTGFSENRWVQAIEVHPGGAPGKRAAHGVVHHVVVYIREPGSPPINAAHGPTKADILQVWAPGTAPEIWPAAPVSMAKLIPAGSHLVFEIHYTPNGRRTPDRTRVGLRFAPAPPAKRVLTLQMSNDRFAIPPGDPNYRVTVWGTLPNDALLLDLFPHMHLRGKAFEFDRIRADGQPEVLLRVPHYDFYWQLAYRLATPLALARGTRLEWIAWFDNSANNPRNPDPGAEVHYGQPSSDEMMIGFFDVAVDRDVDKGRFFVRP